MGFLAKIEVAMSAERQEFFVEGALVETPLDTLWCRAISSLV